MDLHIAVDLTTAGQALTGSEFELRDETAIGIDRWRHVADMITMRQRPHVPSPPHTDARPMPACRAASSKSVPGATSTRLPIGSKSISKVWMSFREFFMIHEAHEGH